MEDPPDAYEYDVLEREKFLTPLPLPPTEGSVMSYNIGNGNCLYTGMASRETLHHNIEVRADETEAFTCFLETDGGDFENALIIAAIDAQTVVPSGAKLEEHTRIFIKVHAPCIVRICLCPISKMLVVSHAAEDYKLYAVGLPFSSSGGWILALSRASGYIRIFDCTRTHQTHWRFPTLLQP